VAKKGKAPPSSRPIVLYRGSLATPHTQNPLKHQLPAYTNRTTVELIVTERSVKDTNSTTQWPIARKTKVRTRVVESCFRQEKAKSAGAAQLTRLRRNGRGVSAFRTEGCREVFGWDGGATTLSQFPSLPCSLHLMDPSIHPSISCEYVARLLEVDVRSSAGWVEFQPRNRGGVAHLTASLGRTGARKASFLRFSLTIFPVLVRCFCARVIATQSPRWRTRR